jgi:hypothetical protein
MLRATLAGRYSAEQNSGAPECGLVEEHRAGPAAANRDGSAVQAGSGAAADGTDTAAAAVGDGVRIAAHVAAYEPAGAGAASANEVVRAASAPGTVRRHDYADRERTRQ